MAARKIPPNPPPLRALNHWCVPCSQHIYFTGDTRPSLALFKRKTQPIRYQQLLFRTTVITCSLLLLPLVSLLLLVLLVLLSPLSFFTSAQGDFILPKACLLTKWDSFGQALVNVGGLVLHLWDCHRVLCKGRRQMCTEQLTKQDNFFRLT